MSKKKKRDPLNLNHQTRTRRDYIDYDYAKELSKEEREWLAKFTDEYYGGAFRNDCTDIHKTDEQRKECYGRNNSAQRCIFNLAKQTEKLDEIIEAITAIDTQIQNINHEETLVELLDAKEELTKKLEKISNSKNKSNNNSNKD